MIRKLAQTIADELAARRCPLPVVLGPERADSISWTNERIVIERDKDREETLLPPTKSKPNPVMLFVRPIRGKITIYAREPEANAMQDEHDARADSVVDRVLCALHLALTGRKAGWSIDKTQPVKIPDLEQSECQGGAIYEILFTTMRAVNDVTWTGASSPEATVGGAGGIVIAGSTSVTAQGNSVTPARTACGA